LDASQGLLVAQPAIHLLSQIPVILLQLSRVQTWSSLHVAAGLLALQAGGGLTSPQGLGSQLVYGAKNIVPGKASQKILDWAKQPPSSKEQHAPRTNAAQFSSLHWVPSPRYRKPSSEHIAWSNVLQPMFVQHAPGPPIPQGFASQNIKCFLNAPPW
jgi:hypothetical protein